MSIAEIVDLVLQAKPEELSSIRGKLHEADALAMERQIQEATKRGHDSAGPVNLTIADFAKEVGVTAPRVYEWIHRREDPLPHIKTGPKKALRIPRAGGIEWARRNEVYVG